MSGKVCVFLCVVACLFTLACCTLDSDTAVDPTIPSRLAHRFGLRDNGSFTVPFTPRVRRTEPLWTPRGDSDNELLLQTKREVGSGERLSYTVGHFMQPIDHFAFQYEPVGTKNPAHRSGSENSKTHFPMRYLYNLQHWGGKGSPIIFYTGNEGDITGFWKNCGFVTNVLSKELRAAVVFAESRYFGTSLPFGKDSLLPPNAIYLTVEQTLEDYASFMLHMLVSLQQNKTLPFTSDVTLTTVPYGQAAVYDETTPIIAVGGSYGGMLSAWIRMKYPQFVAAALAASAPVRQYLNVTDEFAYFARVTEDFQNCMLPDKEKGNECVGIIRQGTTGLKEAAKQSEKWWDVVQKSFNLCQEANDISTLRNDAYNAVQKGRARMQKTILDLLGWYTDTISNVAMVNYPYQTNFVVPVPGWPVRSMCEYLLDNSEKKQKQPSSSETEGMASVWRSMRDSLDHLGVVQPGSCINVTIPSDSFNDDGWDFLACTTQILPTTTSGKSDMFPAAPFDPVSYSDNCYAKYNVRPDYSWMERFTGTSFSECSNTLLSNGQLDPWSTGGILSPPSPSCPTFYMEGAAHHLDLRLPHEDDPTDVVSTRKAHIAWLKKWIEEFHSNKSNEDIDARAGKMRETSAGGVMKGEVLTTPRELESPERSSMRKTGYPARSQVGDTRQH